MNLPSFKDAARLLQRAREAFAAPGGGPTTRPGRMGVDGIPPHHVVRSEIVDYQTYEDAREAERARIFKVKKKSLAEKIMPSCTTQLPSQQV